MFENHSNSSVASHIVLVHKYSILVRNENSDTWSRFFSSHSFATAVEMLLWLDRRMFEELALVESNVEVTGKYLLN